MVNDKDVQKFIKTLSSTYNQHNQNRADERRVQHLITGKRRPSATDNIAFPQCLVDAVNQYNSMALPTADMAAKTVRNHNREVAKWNKGQSAALARKTMQTKRG